MKDLANAVRESVSTVVGNMVKIFVAKALAGLPVSPFLLAAAPAIAALAGGLAKSLIGRIGATAFANGGIVYGPTNALVGEYPGAINNPEVIAPLSKLKDLLDGGSGSMIAETRISGNDLLVLVRRAETRDGRIR
jgi:hypothetical protein